jgi:hypothetical protein
MDMGWRYRNDEGFWTLLISVVDDDFVFGYVK